MRGRGVGRQGDDDGSLNHVSVGCVSNKVQCGSAVHEHGVGACQRRLMRLFGCKVRCGSTSRSDVEVAREGVDCEGRGAMAGAESCRDCSAKGCHDDAVG